ncbi:hypothetical protein LJC56_02160 [Christensenellaceae bacterium OttesenSCG-928-K19]|nr:hypothetical protein [Christensenellaceae bacterium OttesenSCG-928-K19]
MDGQQKGAPKRIKLLVTIVDRGKGKEVREVVNKACRAFHLSFMGRGTAASEILDYLGLGETEKDIVMSVVREECLDEVMLALQKNLRLDIPGNGIAFTIRITSVGGPVTLNVISGTPETLEEYARKRREGK